MNHASARYTWVPPTHRPHVAVRAGPLRGLQVRGEWLCHGHTHQKEFRSGNRMIHVGVDAEVAPIPLELVLEETLRKVK